jgi:adenosylmethionine-8-amino-7-oxononanoate aminotransferase
MDRRWSGISATPDDARHREQRPCGRCAAFLPWRVPSAADLIRLDKSHFWHPFTQMRDWCAPEHEPLIITSGRGAVLRDQHGREYLDGNSTIWTNIHGHGHPRITAAIKDQCDRIAHVSALGLTNEPAILLAAELAALWPAGTLTKVFFTDDGSTAIECAMKMAIQFRQQSGQPERVRFIAFDHAYHGDTMGAAALGGVPVFHDRFRMLGLPVTFVRGMEELGALSPTDCTGVIIEPLIQGAAGMKTWPPGMLRELRAWCDSHDVFLIADEVMTGFGRTGKMFACGHEHVVPDFLCLAKGLTGGTVPLAATLTTERVFNAFLGGYGETFFYGHSYTGNPLGCAAARASLAVFREENTLTALQPKIALLTELLTALQASYPHQVRAVRQCGFIAGIDLAQPGSAPRVCLTARAHRLLTRPIRDTLVLMPPLCTTEDQLRRAVAALVAGIADLV